jgi:hypothetical protein
MAEMQSLVHFMTSFRLIAVFSALGPRMKLGCKSLSTPRRVFMADVREMEPLHPNPPTSVVGGWHKW